LATRTSPLTKGLNQKIYLRKDGKLQGLIEIPPDLQFAYGREKIVKSLKTVDPHEANRRYALMVAKAEAGFKLLRQGPSSHDFEQFAIWLHGYQAAETAASAERNLVSRYDSMDPYSSIQMGKLLDSQQPEELLATVGWAADSFYRDKLGDEFDGLADVIRGSAGYRQVLRDCALVLKDSWRASREALLGRTVSPPRSPALNAKPEESPDGNRAKAEKGRWRIRRYFEEVYLPRSLGTLGAGAVGVKRQTIALFNELIGDPPLYLVSQSQIADFQAQLKMLPDGRLIGQLRQTMTVKEIVAAQIAGTLTVKRLAAGTINKHVMNVKTILRFASPSYSR